MKRPRKPPPKRGGGAPYAPNSTPSQAGQAAGGRAAGRAWLAPTTCALLVLTIVFAYCTWMLSRDVNYARQDLQLSRANALLATQQLDTTFQQLWNRFPQDHELSPADRTLLQTWMRFDREYVFDNQGMTQYRFQVATVHRRIGQGTFVLGDPQQAKEHLQQAIALFEELSREQPTVGSYRSEAADTHVRLAWVLYSERQTAAVEQACRQAAQLIDDAPVPDDPPFNVHCANIFLSLGDLSQRRGKFDQARADLQHGVLLFQQLHQSFPDVTQYRTQLARAQAQLQAVTPISQ